MELEALRWVENWEERWQRVLEEQLMGGVCVRVHVCVHSRCDSTSQG